MGNLLMVSRCDYSKRSSVESLFLIFMNYSLIYFRKEQQHIYFALMHFQWINHPFAQFEMHQEYYLRNQTVQQPFRSLRQAILESSSITLCLSYFNQFLEGYSFHFLEESELKWTNCQDIDERKCPFLIYLFQILDFWDFLSFDLRNFSILEVLPLRSPFFVDFSPYFVGQLMISDHFVCTSGVSFPGIYSDLLGRQLCPNKTSPVV